MPEEDFQRDFFQQILILQRNKTSSPAGSRQPNWDRIFRPPFHVDRLRDSGPLKVYACCDVWELLQKRDLVRTLHKLDHIGRLFASIFRKTVLKTFQTSRVFGKLSTQKRGPSILKFKRENQFYIFFFAQQPDPSSTDAVHAVQEFLMNRQISTFYWLGLKSLGLSVATDSSDNFLHKSGFLFTLWKTCS